MFIPKMIMLKSKNNFSRANIPYNPTIRVSWFNKCLTQGVVLYTKIYGNHDINDKNIVILFFKNLVLVGFYKTVSTFFPENEIYS